MGARWLRVFPGGEGGPAEVIGPYREGCGSDGTGDRSDRLCGLAPRCDGSRRRAAACAPSRAAPSGWSACPAWSRSGPTCSPRGRSRSCSAAATRPTTSCTRWRAATPTGPASPPATAARPRTSRRRPWTPAWSGSSTWAGSRRRGPRLPTSRSRLEVEEILLTAVPASTALRASIVIGAGSSSFRVLVRLVERLRLLPMPRWRSNRTQPIDERDVIEFLASTPTVAGGGGALARHLRPRRGHLRGPDRGDRRGTRRGAHARGPPRLADPAGERGGGGGERPAARARAAADGEPRVRRASARRSRGGADLRHPPASLRARAWSTRCAEWESLEPLGAR